MIFVRNTVDRDGLARTAADRKTVIPAEPRGKRQARTPHDDPVGNERADDAHFLTRSSAPDAAVPLEPEPEPEPMVFLLESHEEQAETTRDLLDSIGIPSRVFHAAQEFLDCPDRNRAGCLIVDVRLRGMGGLILLERLRRDGVLTPVIMTICVDDTATAARAMRSGAFDVLRKPAEAQVLLDRVQQALDGDRDRRLRAARVAEVRQRYESLTDREREVLELVVLGCTSVEIAGRLPERINRKTVEAHRVKIMKKMRARNIAHLVRLAFLLKLRVLDESELS